MLTSLNIHLLCTISENVILRLFLSVLVALVFYYFLICQVFYEVVRIFKMNLSDSALTNRFSMFCLKQTKKLTSRRFLLHHRVNVHHSFNPSRKKALWWQHILTILWQSWVEVRRVSSGVVWQQSWRESGSGIVVTRRTEWWHVSRQAWLTRAEQHHSLLIRDYFKV